MEKNAGYYTIQTGPVHTDAGNTDAENTGGHEFTVLYDKQLSQSIITDSAYYVSADLYVKQAEAAYTGVLINAKDVKNFDMILFR